MLTSPRYEPSREGPGVRPTWCDPFGLLLHHRGSPARPGALLVTVPEHMADLVVHDVPPVLRDGVELGGAAGPPVGGQDRPLASPAGQPPVGDERAAQPGGRRG